MMLRQVQYFHGVVRTGSFTEAAEECFISQSAISQQIKALENDLGVKLLVRENRSFHLTKAGEYKPMVKLQCLLMRQAYHPHRHQSKRY